MTKPSEILLTYFLTHPIKTKKYYLHLLALWQLSSTFLVILLSCMVLTSARQTLYLLTRTSLSLETHMGCHHLVPSLRSLPHWLKQYLEHPPAIDTTKYTSLLDCNSVLGIYANSAVPVQRMQNDASDQGLNCFAYRNFHIDIKYNKKQKKITDHYYQLATNLPCSACPFTYCRACFTSETVLHS